MNRRLLIVAIVVLALLGACTPTIYGVPEATWQQMSEPERVATIEAYRQRQIVLQQAQAERARQRAIEQEAERQRQAEAERHRRRQIEAIYRGQGVYGDLLQVTLSGGMINFSGRHQTYPPCTFRIAQGETRDVTVTDHKGRHRSVRVSYSDGTLVLDSRGAKPNQVARFSFDRSWEDGTSFPPVQTKGDAELRGVQIAVTVLGEPPHRRRHEHEHAASAPPQVIVVQQPAPPPPQVIVIEQPQHRPPRQERQERPERQRPASAQQPVATPPVAQRPAPPQPPSHAEQPAPARPRPGRDTSRMRPDHPAAPPASRVTTAPPVAAELPPARILVRFRRGEVKRKGRYLAFTPADCRLAAGETRRIALQTAAGAQQVSLSYLDGRLTLDIETGPRGKGRNSQAFAAEKSWAQGRAYRFDSPGDQLLKQVEVEVVADHSS